VVQARRIKSGQAGEKTKSRHLSRFHHPSHSSRRRKYRDDSKKDHPTKGVGRKTRRGKKKGKIISIEEAGLSGIHARRGGINKRNE